MSSLGNIGIWSGLHKDSSLIGGPGGSFKTGRVRARFGRSERFDTVWREPGNKHCPEPQRRRALTQNAL